MPLTLPARAWQGSAADRAHGAAARASKRRSPCWPASKSPPPRCCSCAIARPPPRDRQDADRWRTGNSNWPDWSIGRKRSTPSCSASLPRTEVEMVVQCSGNGRAIVFRSGADRRHAMGPRRDGQRALRRRAAGRRAGAAGQSSRKPAARFLTAEGRDDPKPGEIGFRTQPATGETLWKVAAGLRAQRPTAAGRSTAARCGWSRPATTARCTSNGSRGCDFDDQRKRPHQPDAQLSHAAASRSQPGTQFEADARQQRTELADAAQERRALARCRCQVAAGRDAGRGRGFQRRRSTHRERAGFDRPGQTWQQAELDVPDSPYAWYRWQAEVAAGRRASNRSGRARSTRWAAANRWTARSSGTRRAIPGTAWRRSKCTVGVRANSSPARGERSSCKSSAIRSSWLYLASRSLRTIEPILIRSAAVATARSAIVVSSVSPLRAETT